MEVLDRYFAFNWAIGLKKLPFSQLTSPLSSYKAGAFGARLRAGVIKDVVGRSLLSAT